MAEITPLNNDALASLDASFEASEHNRMAMNAVTAAGIDKVARNYDRARLLQRRFSTIVDNGTATHQDRSGRCWLFSSLNVARFVAKKNMGLKEFEFFAELCHVFRQARARQLLPERHGRADRSRRTG